MLTKFVARSYIIDKLHATAVVVVNPISLINVVVSACGLHILSRADLGPHLLFWLKGTGFATAHSARNYFANLQFGLPFRLHVSISQPRSEACSGGGAHGGVP